MFKQVLAVLGFSLFALTAQATPMITTFNDILIGATDVDVDGTLYTVSLREERCDSVYQDCANTDNFDFLDEQTAINALQAFTDIFDPFSDSLLDPQGNLLIRGLRFAPLGQIDVPFGISAPGTIDVATCQVGVSTCVTPLTATIDNVLPPVPSPRTFAVFTRVEAEAEVPEPTTLWLFMSALSAWVGVKRLSRR